MIIAKIIVLTSILAAGPADPGQPFIAFDPVDNICLQHLVTDSTTNIDVFLPDGIKHAAKKILGSSGPGVKTIERLIPLDVVGRAALVASGLPAGIFKARVRTMLHADGNGIRVELSDKLDGQWYRLKARIPHGRTVRRITRSDGTTIANRIWTDRTTGKKHEEIMWYQQGDTVWFYDDPINGYDISLNPPAPSNSLVIEMANQGNEAAGQLSGVVWPYNGGDAPADDDHMGRTDDNNFANDIDTYAGTKIALQVNAKQYGNPYPGRNTGKNGAIVQNDLTTVDISATPDGKLQSAFLCDMSLPSGAPRLVNIMQKVIIRGNDRWFTTIYYITNADSKEASNLLLFQGADWNFQGNYNNDNCEYDAANFTVFGRKNVTSGLAFGGFSGYRPQNTWGIYGGSSGYRYVWNNIRSNNLNEATSKTGDASTAMRWDRASLAPGATWVVPIVWGLGFDQADMQSQIDTGKAQLFDAAVMSIDEPKNGLKINPAVTSSLVFTATVADLGLVDLQGLMLHISINGPGGYTLSDSTPIPDLTVPGAQSDPVSWTWDTSALVDLGQYGVSMYTDLSVDGDSIFGYDVTDSDTSNDIKWIPIYVSDFTIGPDQSMTVDAGANATYTFSLYSGGSNGRYNLTLSPSSRSWPSHVIVDQAIIASDYNGDGIFDFVTSATAWNLNGDMVPDVFVAGDTSLDVKLVTEVPVGTSPGFLGRTSIMASDYPANTDSDSTIADTYVKAPPARVKYLHVHAGNTMDTANQTVAPDDSTVVSGYESAFFVQSPVFNRNSIIYAPIKGYMWVDINPQNQNVKLALMYTNGTDTHAIGEKTIFIDSNKPQYFEYEFDIEFEGQVTVPAGYWLTMRLANLSKSTLNIYHDTSHDSQLMINTSGYISIGSLSVHNPAGDPMDLYAPGDTADIICRASDPFGSSDISAARITITNPSGQVVVNDIAMSLSNTDASDPSAWKDFSYTFNSISAPGTYGMDIQALDRDGVSVFGGSYFLASDSITSNTMLLHPAWSADDASMAYMTGSINAWQIRRVNADGSGDAKLTASASLDPSVISFPQIVHYSHLSWDPGADRVAFAAINRNPSATPNTEIYTVTTGSSPVITRVSPAGGWGGYLDPDFLPAGTDSWLVTSKDGNLVAFKPDDTDLQFKSATAITDIPGFNYHQGFIQPRWSPDGQRIACVRRYSNLSEQRDIYIISGVQAIISGTAQPVTDLADDRAVRITSTANATISPSWSLDASHIAYAEDISGTFNSTTFLTDPAAALTGTDFELFKLLSSGGTRRSIMSHNYNEAFMMMSHNGARLLYSSQPSGSSGDMSLSVFNLVVTGIFGGGSNSTLRGSPGWSLRDYGYSSITLPDDALPEGTNVLFFEPSNTQAGSRVRMMNDPDVRNLPQAVLPAIDTGPGKARYIGVARTVVFGSAQQITVAGSIRIHATDAELARCGLSSGDLSRIRIYRHDLEQNRWILSPGCCVEDDPSMQAPDGNVIRAVLDKPGVYALFVHDVKSADDLDMISVYPNPFKPSDGNPSTGDDRGIRIDNLPSNTKTITIFTVTGRKVTDSGSPGITLDTGSGFAVWNAKTERGANAASGIYIIVIRTQSGKTASRKVAVIR